MNLKTKPKPDQADKLVLVIKKEVSLNKATVT